MALVITIKAAFEVEQNYIGDIEENIQSALDTLRDVGAARVDSAAYDHDLSLNGFMNESSGLGEFEFTVLSPIVHCIDFG